MPAFNLWLGFLLACVIIVAIPGPSLLFVIGRALAEGKRVALLSVLGNASGILVQIVAIALGLGPLVAASATAYGLLKLAGAAYLLWLGIQGIRHRGGAERVLAGVERPRRRARHALRDGFLVGVTNPKTIVFFVALLPQFVNRSGPVAAQMIVLGLTFFAVAVTSDSMVALAAGSARDWFARSPARLRRMEVAGGAMMILLGVVLVFTGRPEPAAA
ncbi:MAG: LysE family translocator [Tetrasphaera sp.]